jgi:4-diphosphocytidyl-2-C-methyl-D-erythritol kinase
LYNDFERVAPCVCGDIAERLMVHGASGALLCGSGSAVFGVFGSEESALGALGAMANEGFDQSWVAPTLTREESLWMS